jgi:hypothetical protein
MMIILVLNQILVILPVEHTQFHPIQPMQTLDYQCFPVFKTLVINLHLLLPIKISFKLIVEVVLVHQAHQELVLQAHPVLLV